MEQYSVELLLQALSKLIDEMKLLAKDFQVLQARVSDLESRNKSDEETQGGGA